MADEYEILRLFGVIDDELGPVEALVNNAGIVGSYGRVDDLDATVLARLWAVNITGPFVCAREAQLAAVRKAGMPVRGVAGLRTSSPMAKATAVRLARTWS